MSQLNGSLTSSSSDMASVLRMQQSSVAHSESGQTLSVTIDVRAGHGCGHLSADSQSRQEATRVSRTSRSATEQSNAMSIASRKSASTRQLNQTSAARTIVRALPPACSTWDRCKERGLSQTSQLQV